MRNSAVSAETLSDTGDYGGWTLGALLMTATEKRRALDLSALFLNGEQQGPCSRWPMSWRARLFGVRWVS